MSVAAEEFPFSLRVILNQQKNKVLFAEVSRGFADVLVSFLTLPLGTIVRLLIKHYGKEAPVLGSLNSLYKGLKNLDSSNFYTDAGKWMLLYPRNSFEAQCRKLRFNFDGIPRIKYYICGDSRCKINPKVACMYYDNMKCYCGKLMNRALRIEDSDIQAHKGDGVFLTAQEASFIVTDDLQIMPNLTESGLQILRHFGVRETDGLEERTVIFGLNEIMKLLERSLVSKTPLTDIILPERKMDSASVKSEQYSFLNPMGKEASSNSKKMTVKAFVQKSTNRVLSAQAGGDFVDFLFSLLTIPLGKVQFLLGSDICLGSIYNLFKSISNLNGGMYLKTRDTINSLLELQLPPKYLSKNQILPLTQHSSALRCSYDSYQGINKFFTVPSHKIETANVNVKDPKGHVSFVKGPKVFMVTDDLVVSLPSAISSLSTLNQMKIPLFDVEEQLLAIGMEEALSILKASITSTSALTNGLKPFLKRQPKQRK